MTQSTQVQISVNVLKPNKTSWATLTREEFDMGRCDEWDRAAAALKEAAKIAAIESLDRDNRVALQIGEFTFDAARLIELLVVDEVCLSVMLNPHNYESGVTHEQLVDIKNMSSLRLRLLSKKCSVKLRELIQLRLEFLEAKEPSLEDAIAKGIKDRSYDTHREGWVHRYEGEVRMHHRGVNWLVKGYGPHGGAAYVSQQGYVEFIPI